MPEPDAMPPDQPLVQRDFSFRDEGIERVVLSHTKRRNALSAPLLAALDAEIEAIAEETRAKVVILAADGPVFSAGHDLRELRHGSAGEVRTVFDLCARLMTRIRNLPAVVIAEVEGVATAAGCQLVAAADLAVAGAAAKFATPGVKIGYFCTTPAVALSRNVGRKAAMEMLVTGDFISAAEALRTGLVNRVVPAGEAGAGALELARRVTPYERETLANGKSDYYRQLELSADEALRYATDIMVANVERPAAREGMSAFLEKRAPNWPT